MNHAKRFLAILLAVILTVGVAVPAAPQLVTLGETLGTALQAEAATPQPLSSQTDTFDMEAEILNAKNVTNVSASDPQLHNWKFVSDYETLKTLMEKDEETYIRLSADIWKQQNSESQKRTVEGAGKVFDHCIIVKNNKVLDLNGHTLEAEDFKNYHQGALFYVIKPTTTLILLDSSTAGTGKIMYHSDVASASYKFHRPSVTDVFFVQDATVYVLGGSYKAGLAKQQDIYTGWEKFVGIGGALLKGALSIGSQALDIYTSITSGGTLGSTGVLSNLKNAFNIDSNDALGMMTNMVTTLSGANAGKDGGQTGAEAPKITSPLAGQGNVEPEVDDLNGRTANTSAGLSTEAAAAEASQGTADTEASGGSGSSVTLDSLGIYVKTEATITHVFKEPKETTASILQKEAFGRGDEIDVLEEKKVGETTWLKIKYKDQEAWIKAAGFVSINKLTSLIDNTSVILENGLKASIQDHGRELLDQFAEKIGAPAGTVGMIEQSANVLTNAVKGVVNACKKYTEKWYQVHWGTCFDLRGSAQLVILDGKFAGHGMGAPERYDKVENGVTKKWVDGECDVRDEVIDCSTGGEVWIMGGEFYGMAGANIFNVGPLTDEANKTKVHVRDGYFNCSCVNRIRGLQPDNKDKSVTVAGVKGTVNLPIEAYGRDLIKDGRIQLTEATGTGNLVVKNRSINKNEITYSLYCAEDELLHLSDLLVSPNESKYMSKSFQLIGNASQEQVLEGSHYINFTIGDMTEEHAFVAPRVDAKDLRSIVGATANEQAIEAEIGNSDAWYYRYPRTDFLKNLRMDDRQSASSAGKQYNYLTDVRVYTYTLHQLDPVTQEELGAPLAVKTVPSSRILTGQLYLSPVEAQYSNGNEFYLYDGWKPGGMYKVTLSVDEIMDVGSPDKTKRDEFGASRRVASCGTTSLIIRCWDAADEVYTPIRFTSENLGPKDTAEVTFLNAQVGRVDIYGQKLFTVQYNWRIAGKVDGKDFDVPLVTSTRKQQGITDPIPIEGHIYDDWEYQHNYHRNYLTEFDSHGVANSVKPYWGAQDHVEIPETITVDGKSVSTAGKQLYCKVTYGLCYYRWAKALKTMPIIEFPATGDPAHLADNAGSDVRQTAEQCTYETKRIAIKATKQDAPLEALTGDTEPIDVFVPHGGTFEKKASDCGLYTSSVIPMLEDALTRWYYLNNGQEPTEEQLADIRKQSILTYQYTDDTPVIFCGYEDEDGQYTAKEKAAEASKYYKYACAIDLKRQWLYSYDGDSWSLLAGGNKDEMQKENFLEITYRARIKMRVIVYYNGAQYKVNGKNYYEDTTLYMEPYHLIPVKTDYYFGTEHRFDSRLTDYGNLETDGWHWNKATSTLTLKNYHGTITPVKEKENDWGSYDCTFIKLGGASGIANIELIGENEITFYDNQYLGGSVMCDADTLITASKLHVYGDGNLTMKLTYQKQYAFDWKSTLSAFEANQLVFDQKGKITLAIENDWAFCEPEQVYVVGGTYYSPQKDYAVLRCLNGTEDAGIFMNSGEILYTIKTPLFDPRDNGSALVPDQNGTMHTLSHKYGEFRFDGSDNSVLMQFPSEDGTPEFRAGVREAIAELALMDDAALKNYLKDGTRGEWYGSLKINDHKHEWGDPVVLTTATATAGGRISVTCEGCEETLEKDTAPFALTGKDIFIEDFTDEEGVLYHYIKINSHPEAEQYEVYRKNRATGEWELVGTGATPDFYDYGLRYQVNYEYKFRMIRTNGDPKVAEYVETDCYILPEGEGTGSYCSITVEDGYSDIDWASLTDTVTITANPAPEGKAFDKWVIVEGKKITIAAPTKSVTTFTIGTNYTQDITVKATYKDPPAAHTITVVSGTADPASAIEGTTITITAAAAPSGQVFDKWIVVKGDVSLEDDTKTTTTFEMVDEDVEVKATYKALPPAEHAITVTSGTASVNSAAKGSTVTVTAAAAPSGQVFDKWVVVKGGVTLADVTKATTTFVMGDEDVEVKATYKAIPAGTHAITVTSGTASVNSAAKGTTVTVTAAAAPSGQTFDKWVVVKGGVKLADAAKATTTFVMGDADVELKATYKAAGGTEPEFLMGDVDGNGKVTTEDARAALRISIGLIKVEEGSREFLAADVDGNGTVATKDARYILRRSIGLKDPEVAWPE